MSDPVFEADAPVDDFGMNEPAMDMGQPMAPQQAPVTYQKQQLNVYTVMLIISLLAMIFGIISLYRVLPQYGTFPYWKTGGSPQACIERPVDLEPVQSWMA